MKKLIETTKIEKKSILLHLATCLLTHGTTHKPRRGRNSQLSVEKEGRTRSKGASSPKLRMPLRVPLAYFRKLSEYKRIRVHRSTLILFGSEVGSKRLIRSLTRQKRSSTRFLPLLPPTLTFICSNIHRSSPPLLKYGGHTA